ncbi:hypothetical protein Ndes2526B_g07187 [Nannochloris sp. 'desiccata']|nr:hypothetical protein KSW81_004775 [Chlorella desiccata (nom. nud.)]KAH7618261.1 hypothetical protein NADE_000456 [Chlorella desiccata (nom. nud.)]
MDDDLFNIEDVGAPIFMRRLDKFIQDLLLARSHLDQGLTVAGKEEISEKLEEFIDYMERQLPKATKEKAHKCLDWSESDPCGNLSVLPSSKYLQLKATPVDFFKLIDGIMPINSPLPRIVATAPEMSNPEENITSKNNNKTNKNNDNDGDYPVAIIAIGEVVLISSDSGPYYVLITDLVDPQSFEGTFACAYGVRLWSKNDISALGFPTKGLEDLLGEDEVALSNFKDLVRPGTVLGGGVFGACGIRLVPMWWADPEALPGIELKFQYYFDYRRLTLIKIDFGLSTEPYKILQWMRKRQISCHVASNWRTWDYLVDRLYHTFNDFFLSFQSPITQDAKLIKLSTIVERDWLLQAPTSVLKTAKYSEDMHGGTLAMWVQTREEAELMLGPSAHEDFPALFPETHYVIQPKTGEAHLDRFTFCIILPMVLWIRPRKEGETDVLSFKAHMQSVAPPVGTSTLTPHQLGANGKGDGSGVNGRNTKGIAQVHWNSKYAVAEAIEAGVMPS